MADDLIPRSVIPRNDLTAEYVRSILDYDPQTGVFTWKTRIGLPNKWNAKHAGMAAGHVTRVGYRVIGIDRTDRYAHRLAWLCMTGDWPEKFIDHRDCNRGNNIWENLREADKSGNARNTKRPKTNTSGLKGATWSVHAKTWKSQITIDGRVKNLGYFPTKQAAHLAYCEAAEAAYGEFARFE